MRTQEIDFRHLIRHVLPVGELPRELQARVEDALASQEPAAAERAAHEAIRELLTRGILRLEEENEHLRRYRNLLTGGIITIHEPVEPPGVVTPVPLPAAGPAPASLVTARELVALAGHILSEDGSRVAEKEQLIQLLVSFAREVLACDDARYLSLERGVNDGLVPVESSGSPFATHLGGEWGPRGNALLIRELSPEQAGNAGYRTAAAIPVGRPDDPVRGALELWSTKSGHFTRERLALLELIAETGRELLANVSRLQELVFIDSRTRIFNKSFFEIQFRNFLARAQREGRHMALAIIDVDNFKFFNSRYGYAGGDEVLFRVAQILQGQVRPFDCVARWGGEEFTVVLAPPVEPGDARAICDRLRRAVELATFHVTGLDAKEHRASVTVSVGGALFPDDGNVMETLWSRANEALLQAKRGGKNRVHFRPHPRSERGGGDGEHDDREGLRVAPA
jgi:diguanylate cyclase (GGDEF)-like protein